MISWIHVNCTSQENYVIKNKKIISNIKHLTSADQAVQNISQNKLLHSILTNNERTNATEKSTTGNPSMT